MKTRNFLLISSACLIVVFAFGCKKYNYKKFAGAEFSPTIALPVINTSIGIEDLVKQAEETGYVKVGPDNLISIIYSQDLISLQANELIEIPDQAYQVPVTLFPTDITTLTTNGSVTFNRTQPINFDTGGDPQADSIIYKEGDLTFNLSSDLQHDVQIIMKIPTASRDGKKFTKTIDLDYNGTTPVVANETFELDGYSFDFTKGGQVNEFDIDYTFTVTSSGQPVSASDAINIEIGFYNNKPSKFFGYVGQTDLTNSLDSIKLDIFKNVIGNGSFKLESPMLEFVFRNSYGIPVEATFPTLEVWDKEEGTIPVSGSGLPLALTIGAPDYTQIGQSVTTSLLLDKTNSNIVQILNATPELIIHKVKGETNPNGKADNFVLDTSRLDISLNVELPLHGSMKNFTLQDTIPFEIIQIDQLNEILFRANFDNGFPFDVSVQLYFADENYTVIDSLFDGEEIILASGTVDGSGKVTSSTEKMTDAILDKAKLQKVSSFKNLIFKTSASTTDNGNTPVKIFADYRVGFKLGIKADADVSVRSPLN